MEVRSRRLGLQRENSNAMVSNICQDICQHLAVIGPTEGVAGLL